MTIPDHSHRSLTDLLSLAGRVAVVTGGAKGIGAQIDPGWQLLAGHIAFLAILAVRPRGLFPRIDG